MALKFYYLSGSPFAWKVWLALEHKALRFDLEVLSADAGDLKSPAFLSLNPRGKVPVVVDDGFALSESAAIVEYLDERYGSSGPPLWPTDDRVRAIARRIAIEGETYIYPPLRRLVAELLMRKDGAPEFAVIGEVKAALVRELSALDALVGKAFLAGADVSAADYAIYPLLAVLNRLATRRPEFDLDALIRPATVEWMGRIEALRFFPSTMPPHWRSS